ncbi:hypothetical protein WR25_13181 [Diploscapter pachys]|uniref:Uncharacterized protein n=1 Tax=Diploscapter pachys TaxID=2018661 RepID=A0A2A2LL51_9BILA|nr:hypothetical protein WR25_13181 [Diploscapter pachys]
MKQNQTNDERSKAHQEHCNEELDELIDFGLEQQQKQTRGQKDEQEKQDAQRAQEEQTDGDDGLKLDDKI